MYNFLKRCLQNNKATWSFQRDKLSFAEGSKTHNAKKNNIYNKRITEKILMKKKTDKVTKFIGPLRKSSKKSKNNSTKKLDPKKKKNIRTNNYLFARQ